MELIAQHGWYFISLAIGSLVSGALAIFWYCRSRRENARLMSALNNMSEGLCMFDASARLILFNERASRCTD
jgi:PAS domain-containing protein